MPRPTPGFTTSTYAIDSSRLLDCPTTQDIPTRWHHLALISLLRLLAWWLWSLELYFRAQPSSARPRCRTMVRLTKPTLSKLEDLLLALCFIASSLHRFIPTYPHPTLCIVKITNNAGQDLPILTSNASNTTTRSATKRQIISLEERGHSRKNLHL